MEYKILKLDNFIKTNNSCINSKKLIVRKKSISRIINNTSEDINEIDFNECSFDSGLSKKSINYLNNIKKVNYNNCLFKSFIPSLKVIMFKSIELDSMNLTYYNFNRKYCTIVTDKIVYFDTEISDIKIMNEISSSEIKFQEISFNNNIKLNKLLLDNINIWILSLENINNNFESFELRNCNIDKLIIKNSNLWKAVFNWVTIWKLEIQNATLNDCIFNWVDFEDYELEEIVYKPKIIKKLKEYKNKTDIDIIRFIDYKCMKDNYRQLKHVMDKNWNHTEANNFFALEMEMYMKSINIPENLTLNYIINGIFEWKNIRNISEKIILAFSKILNNYWTNAFQNILAIFIYLMVAFFLVLLLNAFWAFVLSNCPYFSNYCKNINSIFIWWHIIWLIFLYYMFTKDTNRLDIIYNKVNSLEKSDLKIFWLALISILLICSYWWEIWRMDWFYTLTYLLNPFSWLTPNSMSHLLWTEQIWMIIHKIIYWILIYQLIISLKRTTKR